MSALLAGGILGGSLIGAGSQKNTNEAMMDFAKEMSSTQYQRAVEDMRAAGINPVMAAGQGGAAAPTANLTAPGASVQSGLMSAARALAIDVPQAQANIEQQGANTAVAKETAKRVQEETKLTQANTAVQRANAKIQNAQVPEAEMRGEPWKQGQNVYNDLKQEVTRPHKNKPEDYKKLDQEDAKKRQQQSASKAYEQGKGTVYGGKNSAKSMDNIPTGRGSIQ